MTPTEWTALLAVVLGGGGISVWITALITRKKYRAEVTDIKVSNLLDMEDRAYQRYTSTQEALDAVRHQLQIVEDYVRQQENYINLLHEIMDANNVDYPKRPAMVR